MGISSQVIKNGNGTDYPKRGDTITIEYTGYLYEPSAEANDYKGKVFDSSVGRGDFVTKIGEGKVIRGWDDGVIDMSLGERSTLTISSDFAYGERGFPGHIPPGADLIFDVELKGINDKKVA